MRRLIRTRGHLKKKANKTRSKYLHQAFQQIRNKATYDIRKIRSDYYSKKIKESSRDMRSTWKILKRSLITITSPQVSMKLIWMVRLFLMEKVFQMPLMITLFPLVTNWLVKFWIQSRHSSTTICQKQATSIPDSYLREFSQNRYFDILSKLKNVKGHGAKYDFKSNAQKF